MNVSSKTHFPILEELLNRNSIEEGSKGARPSGVLTHHAISSRLFSHLDNLPGSPGEQSKKDHSTSDKADDPTTSAGSPAPSDSASSSSSSSGAHSSKPFWPGSLLPPSLSIGFASVPQKEPESQSRTPSPAGSPECNSSSLGAGPPKEHQCGDCERSFDTKNELICHCINTHGRLSGLLPETKPAETKVPEKQQLVPAISNRCNLCGIIFSSPFELNRHYYERHSSVNSEAESDASRSDSESSQDSVTYKCVNCENSEFNSRQSFEEHLKLDAQKTTCKVSLRHLPQLKGTVFLIQNGKIARISRKKKGLGGGSAEDLKLRLKISSTSRGRRGRKRQTAEIVTHRDMTDSASPPPPQENSTNFMDTESTSELSEQSSSLDHSPAGEQEELSDKGENSEHEWNKESESDDRHTPPENAEAEHDEPEPQQPTAPDHLEDEEAAAPESGENSSGDSYQPFDPHVSFGPATPNEAPPSTYQPQFESFPGDWFGEYDSETRIAAAMTGTNAPDSGNNQGPVWPAGNDADKRPMAASDLPNASSNDGLFSQTMLGKPPHSGPEGEQRQGSFEELCLNDAFNSNQPRHESHAGNQFDGRPEGHSATNDLLTDLEYLNSGGQQPPGNSQIVTSPHGEVVPPQIGVRPATSGTPTASGQPTPSPGGSFHSLTTSPMTSPTPPSVHPTTPPVPTSSPLQQMQSMQGPQLDGSPMPRLTVASNLMAPQTTTSSSLLAGFGQQWTQPTSNTTFQSPFPRASAMVPGMRGPIPPNVRIPYQPSPPPRVRGRPPLMGHAGRPMMRGPGRPPGNLLGGRGPGLPPLQRLPPFTGSTRAPLPQAGTQKRQMGAVGTQSPSKRTREDVDVPSRQKDQECQIIAVANKSDGLYISNVQGGREDKGNSRASPGGTSNTAPIHLSDSITLSVRNNEKEVSQRQEKNGPNAGVVANLLASRGITVTPAAGEKEGEVRDDRRLPTASELNLSSAISVHPPTSRDRDGFAVPSTPAGRNSSSTNSTATMSTSQVERPPRPPTVDLTQDVSPVGALGTRHQCSQCRKTFPNAGLLADHAKVHQQQQSARMPFKCHLCSAGFSSQKGQQHHYQNFHQLHLSANDIAIPVVDLRHSVNLQRMAALGIRSFLPLSNLQNRGSSGAVGIPILTLENIRNGQMSLQQWGISDVLSLGPAKTLNMPR